MKVPLKPEYIKNAFSLRVLVLKAGAIHWSKQNAKEAPVCLLGGRIHCITQAA